MRKPGNGAQRFFLYGIPTGVVAMIYEMLPEGSEEFFWMHFQHLWSQVQDPVSLGVGLSALYLIFGLINKLKKIEDKVEQHDQADKDLKNNVDEFKEVTDKRLAKIEDDISENTKLTREIKGAVDVISKRY